MRRIYSATFDLGEPAPPPMDAVIDQIEAWVTSTERRHERLLAPEITHNFRATGTSNEADRVVETLRWKGGWALRWVQPAGEAGQPEIISEVVLRFKPERLSLSIHIGYRRDIPQAPGVAPKRPRLVLALIKTFGAVSGHPITVTSKCISTADVNDFVEALASLDRRLPVVLLSVHPDLGRPVCRSDYAADILAGLAHVYQLADVEAGFALTDAVGKRHSCFNGCGRVYWPRWSENDDPFRHPLFWPDELEPGPNDREYRGANRLLQVIAPATVSIPHEHPESFLEARLEVERDKGGEDSSVYEGLVALYEQDLEEKANEVDQLRNDVGLLKTKLAALEQRRVPLLKVAVCMGSAEDPRRELSWERRLGELSRESGVQIDREYFHDAKLPNVGFDVWIIDEKTVAGHKEYKHRFPGEAKRLGAKVVSARDTTDVKLARATLGR